MAVIELVTESLEDSEKANASRAAAARRRPRATTAPAAETPVDESPEQVSPDASAEPAPTETLVGDAAEEQATPSKEAASDDVDAKEAGEGSDQNPDGSVK